MIRRTHPLFHLLFAPSERRFAFAVLTLSLMALIGYILFTFHQVSLRGWFEYVGCDFRTYYASGQLFRDYGPRAMYDLTLHEVYQKVLYDRYAVYTEGWSTPFYVLPTPYLPVFMLPFVGLSFLPPFTAFLVWEGANALATWGYLWLWTKRLGLRGCTRLMVITVIFLGVQNFYNLFFSQTNLILMVAVGEALHNLMEGREGRAGLWLTLGLIKPQAILLLALVLFVLRGWRFRVGFVVGALLIGGSSWAMLGWQGVRDYAAILSSYTPVLRIGGITWMSLVDNLVLFGFDRSLALEIGLVVVILILGVWLYTLWLGEHHLSRQMDLAEIFLLTLAAQMVVALHGHVHQALALAVPWMVYLKDKDAPTPWYVFITWVIVPGLVFLLAAIKSVGYAALVLGMVALMTHVLILLLLYRTQRMKMMTSTARS